MRYIPIVYAKPGMPVAYDIFDAYGRVLISKHAELTDKYIEKLTKLGFAGIYIYDELSKGIEIEALISAKLKASGLQGVRERNIEQCKEVANGIVNEILSKGNLSLDLSDLRGYDDYTYAHSVNVAVLASIIGYGMGLKAEELAKVVLAGLLHDLGKLAIPSGILNKEGRLTAEEFQIMQSHATVSFDIIKDRTDISAQVKQAVLYHHENVDGSGYPHGVDGKELTIYAKIIHVADVYDALVSNRPYKKPYSPYEASEYMMGGCGMMFDKEVVEAFLKYVPLYPKGSLVRTSDGREAIIVNNTGAHNIRPIIRLMDGTDLDLTDDKNLNITIKAADDVESAVTEASEVARKKMIQNNRRFQVLVFDYDSQEREKFYKALHAQYDIIVAKSVSQALTLIEREKVLDLVIMDIKVPNKNGVICAQKILEKTQNNIPIIIVTSISDRETVMSCRMMGIASYILKPFNPAFLKSEMKRILTGECELSD